MFPPAGSLLAYAEASLGGAGVGAGGEFVFGHIESKVVGNIRESTGSAAGLLGLPVSPF